ncbi:hypothetical protein JCGZ_09766 [Jatropha curcas]|uniref:FAD-binding PCMH-type domain-containing protein n=1 Tax=Jatropha curcas TaxID=180498 RepID=A0A067KJD9_JATCU|nr:berberine bridge enzyme-like 9 [Jatropha curcas]KDP36346.1 hypothetical protein JCGZ_09766 [Jatropha curcas]
MKLSAFSLFSILLISVSSADEAPNVESFTQCLNENSKENPISDAIIGPDNPSFKYTFENYIKNLIFVSAPKPIIIVTPKHESHVQATVICCKKLGLQIRIRSGGHDYDGLSYTSKVPFVLLDMFNLRSINVDIPSNTASAQAGATLGELYYAIANKSNVHAFPAGVCLTLGLGGHFSGGGYGNMMRKYGLSIDNILDAQIVNAKGEILDRKSMGEDLFWAIRGGGGANFGVILSWKIALVWVPEKVTCFQVDRFKEGGAIDMLVKWQEVATDKLDRDLFLRAMLMPGTGEDQKKFVKAVFVGMFLGDKARLLTLLSGSFPELGLKEEDCNEMRWVESTMIWVGMKPGLPVETLLNRTNKASVSYMARKSDFVQEPISKEDYENIWNIMIENGAVGMAFNPYGGRMSEIPETDTPFPHRKGNLYKIQYSCNWKEKDAATARKYINLTRSLYKAMTPYVSKNPRESFLNYRDFDLGSIGSNGNGSFKAADTYGHSYFKENFERLISIKAAVDPENFFRFEQSIPVCKEASGKNVCKSV